MNSHCAKGVEVMNRRSSGWSGGITTCLALVLAAAGCERWRPSPIVKMVEDADAGDLRTTSVGSLVGWFQKHPALAMKADSLCLPVRENALAKWPETAVLLLERSDFQSWTAGVVRKLMWIGGFYTLLIFGPTWIPAIVDSVITVGQNAAGTGALAPGDVYTRGLQIAGTLLKGSSDAGFFTNIGSALALVLAALMAFLAFLVITVQFVVAIVESYIVVSAGFIFLGFGGSHWTAPYVERYIGLAVGVGSRS